jgi:hypothetical protein
LDFKLKRSGEEIGLSQLVERQELVLDSIAFSEQERNIAYGRFPDGGADWSTLFPTPNASNAVFQAITIDKLTIYPNPAQDYVSIELEGAIDEKITVELLNTFGQVVLKEEINYPFQTTVQNLNLDHIRSGIYLIRITLEEETKVQKLIIAPFN